jgi:hypothetical protein
MIRRHQGVKGEPLPPRFGAFDCETEGLYGKARLICLVLNTGEEFVFQGDNCVDEFLAKITGRQFRGYHFYAHNLSFDMEKTFGYKFKNSLDNKDFKLILSGSKLIKAVYNVSETHRITLLDTFNLIPMKLSRIGEDLGFEKFKTPEKWLTGKTVDEITKEDIDYCIRDCKIVLEILNLYNTIIRPFHIKLKVTEASNAKACWKSVYLSKKPLFLDEVKDEKFRQSYYGGRTEVFIRRHIKQDLYYYDINSLYPHVMMHNKFPNPDKLKYSKDIEKVLHKNEGCAKLTVKAPDIKYPVLPVRRNRLIFPTGSFTGVWNFPEIRLALEKGYIIEKTHWILSSPPLDSPFTDYLKYFMKLKIKYHKENKFALRNLAKRMMNSLYGKFAQRIDIEDRYTHDLPLEGVPYKKLGKNTYLLKKNANKERANETVVSWASYITSYARCLLYSFFPVSGLHYCDTDSIVVESPLKPELVDETEFGLMSLEDKIIESFFVAPKRYAYKNACKEIVKRLKGVPKQIVDEIPLQSFGYPLSVFYNKPYKLKTALRKNVDPFTREEIAKTLQTDNNKRIFDDSGDSKPIFLSLDDEN